MAGRPSETLADRIRELAEREDLERRIHRGLSYGEMQQLRRLLDRVVPPEEVVA